MDRLDYQVSFFPLVLLVFASSFFYYVNSLNWEQVAACNDLFFSADTNEVYLQSDMIMLNLDMMKHFVSYSALFIWNKLFFFLGLEKSILFSFIGGLNIALAFIFFRMLEVKTLSAIFLCGLFLSAFTQMTVGIFPETYGITLNFVWLYLILFYKGCPSHINVQRYEVVRLISACLIGSTHLPLAALYFIGSSAYFDKHPERFLMGCAIVGSVCLMPYLGGMVARGPDEVLGYAGMYASPSHLVDLQAWKLTFFNIFGVSVVSPIPALVNEYALPYSPMGKTNKLAMFLWLSFLGLSAFRVLKIYSMSKEVSGETQVLLVILSMFVFYVFLSPESSALYGVTLLPFFFTIIAKAEGKVKQQYFCFAAGVIIAISLFVNFQALNAPVIPEGECRSWGVKTGLGRVL